jgi:hypothetical protein
MGSRCVGTGSPCAGAGLAGALGGLVKVPLKGGGKRAFAPMSCSGGEYWFERLTGIGGGRRLDLSTDASLEKAAKSSCSVGFDCWSCVKIGTSIVLGSAVTVGIAGEGEGCSCTLPCTTLAQLIPSPTLRVGARASFSNTFDVTRSLVAS